jgi:hypothetical protein
MLFNSKSKLFKRFNTADIIIIIIAVAIVFGLVYRFDRERSNSLLKSPDNIKISFYIESLKGASLFQKGDTVRDKDTNAVFGEIHDVILDKSIDYGVNSEGVCIVSSKPLYNSVTIVVEGKGNYSDTGAFFNNSAYYLNNNITSLAVGHMPPLTARIIKIEKL